MLKWDERLAQQRRFGTAAEKVAENILEDLFTLPLDWHLAEVNNQAGYADLVLTRLGVKHLIVEVKRPGALAWNERSVDLAQAHRYADEQKVRSIAVSDGIMLYARDHIAGGHRDRVFVGLDQADARLDLRWLSTDGIYRPRGPLRRPPASPAPRPRLHPAAQQLCSSRSGSPEVPAARRVLRLRRQRRRHQNLAPALPARRRHPDLARLPKAIQAILSNYRGAHVSSISEAAIPEVLVTLARTARMLGKLPATGPGAPRAYAQLQEALDQLGRLADALTP